MKNCPQCGVEHGRSTVLCSPCYRVSRSQNDSLARCSIIVCDSVARTLGLCDNHYQLQRKYGLTYEQREELIARNNGVCPICLDEPQARSDGAVWAIDHDHRCCPGRQSCGSCLRGAICLDCNLGIGKLNDDAMILRRAADYLDKYDPPVVH